MYKFKLYDKKNNVYPYLKKGFYLKSTIYSNKTEYNNTVNLVKRLIEIGYISHSMNYKLSTDLCFIGEHYLETIG